MSDFVSLYELRQVCGKILSELQFLTVICFLEMGYNFLVILVDPKRVFIGVFGKSEGLNSFSAAFVMFSDRCLLDFDSIAEWYLN